MKSLCLISLLCLLSCVLANAGNAKGKQAAAEPGRKWSYAMEWAARESMLQYKSFQYMTMDSGPVEESFFTSQACHQANIYGRVSYRLSHCWDLSAYCGYERLSPQIRALPLLVGAKYSFPEYSGEGRFFTGIAAGPALAAGAANMDAWLGRISGGYSFYLGYGLSAELSVLIAFSLTHPELYNEYDNMPVDASRLGYSYDLLASCGLSLALVFGHHR